MVLKSYFSIDVSHEGTVKEWKKRRTDSKLDFSIPMKINGVKLSEEDKQNIIKQYQLKTSNELAKEYNRYIKELKLYEQLASVK